AGHLWAREHLSPGEQEREALAQRLADAIVGDELLCGPINPAVTAVVEQTTHALSSSALVWLREADESQVAALDERARDLIPTLDGCELDPSTIEFWVHLGARSGELRMLLDQAGFARLDTCNAPELLEALAPDRYDTCDAS
ncbi:MAG: hypothetical protein KDC46_13980, partial [Thermoleophilia bacterium]|nr:hypothetical protein [Thermoleophilia bacterium]